MTFRPVQRLVIVNLWLLLNCCSKELPEVKDHISTFPDNMRAALSFAFDDGGQSTFSTIVPILNEYSCKATFFIVPGFIADSDWAKWKSLQMDGFEIANHSMNHRDLTQLDKLTIMEEVNEAYETIQLNTGVASFAPPGHRHNLLIDSIVHLKHRFIRTSATSPSQWHGWTTETKSIDIISRIREATEKGCWYIIAAHGVDDGCEPVTENMFRKTLSFVNQIENQIAIGTFAEISAYAIVRDHSDLNVIDVENGKVVEVNTSLPDDYPEVRLTVVINGKNVPTDFIVSSSRPDTMSVLDKGTYMLLSCPANTTINLSW